MLRESNSTRVAFPFFPYSFIPSGKDLLGRPRHVDMIVRRPLDLQPAAVELHLGFSLRASRERGGDKRRA